MFDQQEGYGEFMDTTMLASAGGRSGRGLGREDGVGREGGTRTDFEFANTEEEVTNGNCEDSAKTVPLTKEELTVRIGTACLESAGRYLGVQYYYPPSLKETWKAPSRAMMRWCRRQARQRRPS